MSPCGSESRVMVEAGLVHIDDACAADFLTQDLPNWRQGLADLGAAFVEPTPGNVDLEDLLEEEVERPNAHAALRAEVGCQGPELGPKATDPALYRQGGPDGLMATGAQPLRQAETCTFRVNLVRKPE